MAEYINQYTGNIVKSDTAPGEGLGYLPYTGSQDLTGQGVFENKTQSGQVYLNPTVSQQTPTGVQTSGNIQQNGYGLTSSVSPFSTNPPAVTPSTDFNIANDSSSSAALSNLVNQFQQGFNQDTPFLQNINGLYGNLAQLGADLGTGNDLQAPDLQQQYKDLTQQAGISGMNDILTNLNQQQSQAQGQLDTIRAQAQQLQNQYQGYINSIEGQGGFENIIGGRQARLAKDLQQRLIPLQQAEQNAISNLNRVNQQIQNQQATIQQTKQDILQQINLGQQNFENLQSIEATRYGRKKDQYGVMKDLVDSIQKTLEKQAELAAQGKVDNFKLIDAMLKIPAGLTITLPDGSQITGLKNEDPNVQSYVETTIDPVTGNRRLTGAVYDKNTGTWSTTDLGEAPASSTSDVNAFGLNPAQQAQYMTKLSDAYYARTKDLKVAQRNIGVINTGYDEVKKALGNGTSLNPGSQAAIIAFNKLLDPTSVVRESEYARTPEGVSLLSRLQGFQLKLSQGGAGLTLQEVGALKDTANALLNGYIQDSISAGELIKRQAENLGIDPRLVLPADAWGSIGSFGSTGTIPTQNQSLPQPVQNRLNGKTLYRFPDGTTFEATEQEFRDRFGGFTNDLGTSLNGQVGQVTIPQSSRLAYVNNNPGNLRYAGQSGATQGEGGFARFRNPLEGFKALINQVKLDASRNHTLASFINKYAPPSENNTSQYLAQISQRLGLSPSTKISQIDAVTLAKLIAQKESSTNIG